MALYANIGDIVKIYQTEFKVIGISVLTYKKTNKRQKKDKTYIKTICQYSLLKVIDNVNAFLFDDLYSDDYIICTKLNKSNFWKIKDDFNEELLVLKTIGEVNCLEHDSFYLRYNKFKNWVIVFVNQSSFHGKFISKKNVKINHEMIFKEDILSKFLPQINEFHNDNQIKNVTIPIENGINIGNGLLINDYEYFVLSKSHSEINNYKFEEYQLFNNNTKQNCWLKFYKDKYYLFSEIKNNKILDTYTEGYKKRETIGVTYWETMNNTECYYKIYQDKYLKEYYLEEEWESKTQYFRGIEVDYKKFLLISYKYELPNLYSNIVEQSIGDKLFMIFSLILSMVIIVIPILISIIVPLVCEGLIGGLVALSPWIFLYFLYRLIFIIQSIGIVKKINKILNLPS